MVYTWDTRKQRLNKQKHGISFEEALDVFDDPYLLVVYDEAHSSQEDRYKFLGRMRNLTIAMIIRIEQESRIRIISARKATSYEVRLYYEKIKKND